MAVLAAAALLDELMGRNRNIAPTDKVKELNWEDPDYCKLYMVKFCPHDLFVNTRADLGQCPKVHDDEVKNLFEKSNSYKKQQYEDEFIRFCQSMLNEVGRKIVKGKQRLALIGKAEPVSISPAQTQKNEEQIQFLSAKINKLVEEAEAMGIQGNVEQAQGLMKLCDQLKEEREQLRGSNDNSHWQATAELAAAQEKQMEVCDVCGAFLIVGDAQQRIDDHLMGKQHVGYARLKQALQEITKQREEKEKKREEERRERSSKTRDDDRRRDKERERERGERGERSERAERGERGERAERGERGERGGEREDRRRKREEEERKRPRGGRGRSRSPRGGHRHSSGSGGGFHKRYHGDDKEGRRHKDDKRHRRSRSRDRKNANKREEHHRSGKHTDKDRGMNFNDKLKYKCASNGEQHRSGSPHRRHISSRESRSSHKHSSSGLGSAIFSENTENGDIGGCGGGGGGEQQS